MLRFNPWILTLLALTPTLTAGRHLVWAETFDGPSLSLSDAEYFAAIKKMNSVEVITITNDVTNSVISARAAVNAEGMFQGLVLAGKSKDGKEKVRFYGLRELRNGFPLIYEGKYRILDIHAPSITEFGGVLELSYLNGSRKFELGLDKTTHSWRLFLDGTPLKKLKLILRVLGGIGTKQIEPSYTLDWDSFCPDLMA